MGGKVPGYREPRREIRWVASSLLLTSDGFIMQKQRKMQEQHEELESSTW